MKLGLLSDVHGNRVALAAVLADGRNQGVDTWWALGDLVAIGPDPVPTLELLTSVPNLHVTRGNTDRYVVSGDRPPPYPDEVAAKPELLGLFAAVEGSFAWTRGALASHGWLDWLAELPLESRATLPDGTRLLGVHASPGRDDGAGITPDRPEPELRTVLADAAADLVCAGHTHRPTDRQIGPVHAVNLGPARQLRDHSRRPTWPPRGASASRLRPRGGSRPGGSLGSSRTRIPGLFPAGRAHPVPVSAAR